MNRNHTFNRLYTCMYIFMCKKVGEVGAGESKGEKRNLGKGQGNSFQ